MPYVSADALTLLHQLAAEVAYLRRVIEAGQAGVATGAEAALVTAAFAVAGLREFGASELICMAARPGIPEHALRALLGGRNAKAVGKLLAAAAGKPCSDTSLLLLRRPGRRGCTWQVTHTAKPAYR